MIDYRKEIVSNLLSLGLKVYNENFLSSDIPLPCISYSEGNNQSADTGDTLGYSYLNFNVKIWAKDLQTISKYSIEIDAVMRRLGFSRIGTSELWLDGIGQMLLRYRALAVEQF